MLRPITIVIGLLLLIVLIVPAIMVQFMPNSSSNAQVETRQAEQPTEASGEIKSYVNVKIYRMASKTIETVPLEEYVLGVVASEMPAEFEMEALKAQALAARTYIVRRLIQGSMGDTPEGSHVTDSMNHQVYHDEQQLRELWGNEYQNKIARIGQAIAETNGQVLTYEGQPIDATFFSTSNGYTENSEEYWGQEIPYLRSVESPWDEQSPRFQEEIAMSIDEFQEKLGANISLPAASNQPFSEILSRTAGNRISEIKIGETVYSGKEIRERLGLNSSHFEWRREGNQIIIETTGWGHGVGMSQWGANGMAQNGHTAEEIVKYYYQNIHIEEYKEWIVKK